MGYLEGFGFSVLAPEQHFPQQAPQAQAMKAPPSGLTQRYRAYGWRPALASKRAARRRLFEASRGDLPKGVTVETTCGVRACVNLDHLRVTRSSSAVPMCRRGHE